MIEQRVRKGCVNKRTGHRKVAFMRLEDALRYINNMRPKRRGRRLQPYPCRLHHWHVGHIPWWERLETLVDRLILIVFGEDVRRS